MRVLAPSGATRGQGCQRGYQACRAWREENRFWGGGMAHKPICPTPPPNERWAIARVHRGQAVQSAERKGARQWPIKTRGTFLSQE